MAQIFKIKSTRPLPVNPDIVEKNKKRYLRLIRGGNRSVLLPITECGTRYRDESKKWYIQYKTSGGKWKRVAGYTDKDATRQLAADLDRNTERKLAGLDNPYEKAELLPIMKHLQEFRDYLEGKGCSVKHFEQTFNRIRKAFEGCQFSTWNDISASHLVAWLADQRMRNVFGIKTSNYYQSAAKEFCGWMVKDRRARQNPLSHLTALNAATDVRRKRRAVTEEEFKWLIHAAASGPCIQCVAGEERATLYILACWTGYRRKELASLTKASFDFNSTPPVVRVSAAYSKRKRNDSVPIHKAVVSHLEKWFASIPETPKNRPIFSLKTSTGKLRRTSKMMKLDLARARKLWIDEAKSESEKNQRLSSDFLKYCDEDGLFADFHANRHTFISNLGRAGVSPKLAQTLARHSDPKLTMNIYTHVESADQASAIEQLAPPPSVKSESIGEKYTGETVAQGVAQTSGTECHSEANLGKTPNSVGDMKPDNDMKKPSARRGFCAVCQSLSSKNASSGGGIRTPDTRIMIPLL